LPRYFFHVHDGVDIRDLEGTEFPDITAARKEAIIAAGMAITEMGDKFWIGEFWRMTVTNADGLVLFELHFIGTAAAAAPSYGSRAR
jgi:hypothetical protein